MIRTSPASPPPRIPPTTVPTLPTTASLLTIVIVRPRGHRALVQPPTSPPGRAAAGIFSVRAGKVPIFSGTPAAHSPSAPIRRVVLHGETRIGRRRGEQRGDFDLGGGRPTQDEQPVRPALPLQRLLVPVACPLAPEIEGVFLATPPSAAVTVTARTHPADMSGRLSPIDAPSPRSARCST